MKNRKIILWGIIAVSICIIALPIIILAIGAGEGIFVGLLTAFDENNFQKHTTPLTAETINDLCIKLQIPDTDKRCKPGAVVYAPEFFSTIVNTLQPNGGKWANFDEVQAVLGKYLVKKEDPVKLGNGKVVFSCIYDLRGDRVYPIGVTFYQDGSMYIMSASTG